MDEAVLLVYPDQMRVGKMPYVDFETFYGPANLWVLRAAYSVFHVTLNVERAVGMLYRIAIALAIYALGMRFSRTLATLAALLSALVSFGVPSALAIAWLGGTGAALWSLCFLTANEPRWRTLAAGALAAFALLFRPDLGPGVMVASAIALWPASRSAKRDFVISFAAGLVPLALLATKTGARPLLDNLFILPVFQNAGRHLPITGSMLEGVIVLLFFSFAAIAASIVCVRRAIPCALTLVAVSALMLGMLPQALQRADDGHLFLVAIAAVAWAIVPICVMISNLKPAWPVAAIAGGAFMLAVLCMAFSRPDATDRAGRALRASFDSPNRQSSAVEVAGRRFLLENTGEAEAAAAICYAITTAGSPGERLFVGPRDLRRTNYNDSFFYYLLPQFPPATYFLEMNPMSANRPNSRLAADIATAEWAILDARWDHWAEPNSSGKFASDQPLRVLAQQFTVVDKAGTYLLLRKNRGASTKSAADRSAAQ